MTIVDLGLALVAGGALVGAAAVLVAPVRVRAAVAGGTTTAVGLGGVLAGIGGLVGPSWARTAPGLLPLGEARLALDPLGGIFLLLVGAVAVAAGVYAIGYTAPHAHAGADHGDHPASSRTAQATLPLFVAAMLGVPAAASVTTFLVLWEAMALTSLVLVLTEHRLRPTVRQAGLWYAAMTHAGLVAIMTAFALLAAAGGGESFDALRSADLAPAGRAAVFLLALAGFGSKAGLVPLHVWLPRAHPEAPSHVSALMSAAMVTLGLYGLLRVVLDVLGGGPLWWGLVVMALGAASALHGVLQAGVATDLKRLLAYSTSENVGLMLLGVGGALVASAEGNRPLAGVLVAAAVLHALTHAAFKTVLFLGAGAVLRSTGLRDLDALGGLAPRMPATTGLMAVGVLGAAALPGGAGFVSEWMLLQGLIHSIPSGAGAAPVVAVTMPVAVGVVALTAGLGVVTFVKAFGIGFLALPRSAAAARADDGPPAMRAGMGIAAAACVVLGLAPALLAGALGRVVGALPGSDAAPLADSAVTLRLSGIAGSMSPLLVTVGVLAAAAAAVVVVRRTTTALHRTVPVWGCGGVERDPRQEYTATSFAEPLIRVFDDVLQPEQDLDVTPVAESRYLLESVSFRQQVPDRLEARLYPPLVAAVEAWGRAARRLGGGSVHRYLAYGFVGLLAALVAVAVTA